MLEMYCFLKDEDSLANPLPKGGKINSNNKAIRNKTHFRQINNFRS